jgi:hypothetical protein
MTSANVEFRANGRDMLHQIQFRFAALSMPAYASMIAAGCQLSCGPSAISEVGIRWSSRKAIKRRGVATAARSAPRQPPPPRTYSPNRLAPKQWMRSPFLRARSNIRKRSQGQSRAGHDHLSSGPTSASRRAKMCQIASRPCRVPDQVRDSSRRAEGPGMKTTPIRDRPPAQTSPIA